MRIVIIEEKSVDIPDHLLELLQAMVSMGGFIRVIKYIKHEYDLPLKQAKDIVDEHFAAEKEEAGKVWNNNTLNANAVHILDLMEEEWNHKGGKESMNILNYLTNWKTQKETHS